MGENQFFTDHVPTIAKELIFVLVTHLLFIKVHAKKFVSTSNNKFYDKRGEMKSIVDKSEFF